MKKRTAVPRATKDRVLREFNHRCAVCGGDGPHLHHIDGMPSNHEPQNLIPLCPNCHLGDQHNPTARVEPRKLGLFRQFKDPTILAPQFDPLFQRLRFLDGVEAAESMEAVSESAAELIDFVRALEMGAFYSERFAAIVKEPKRFQMWTPSTPEAEYQRDLAKHFERYRQALVVGRDRVYALAVELLRYQHWMSPTESAGRAT
jgi:hypothetical protein